MSITPDKFFTNSPAELALPLAERFVMQGYYSVCIGHSFGGNAMRALCLAFDNVTLLPYFDKLQEDRLLYIPAFAVRTIDMLGALKAS